MREGVATVRTGPSLWCSLGFTCLHSKKNPIEDLPDPNGIAPNSACGSGNSIPSK